MQSAAFAAVDAKWFVSGDIVRHFDDPQVAQEKTAHANLVRHIFTNPFRTVARPMNLNDNLRHLAQFVYDGEASSLELSNALKEEGNVELVQRRGAGLFEDDPDALGPLLRKLATSGEWLKLRDAAWRHRRPLGAEIAARHVLASFLNDQ